MKKYKEIFLSSVKTVFIYRFNINLNLFTKFIEIATLYFVWKAIYSSGDVASYNFSEIISYLILSSFLLPLFFPNHIFRIGNLVKSGKLTNFILKPYNFFIEVFMTFIGGKILDFILLVVVVIFNFIVIQSSPHNLLSFLLLILNFFCLFIFGLLLSNLSFYLTELWSLRPLYNSLMALVGGGLFPLDLLPKYLYDVVSYSPFSLFGFINVKILQGKLGGAELFHYTKLSIFYLVIFSLAYYFLWKMSLKKYEGVMV